ncbi:MAG: SprT-like domain-containing protein [Gammaproteobacteria bacterium]|nr:SprT-like domain-containing protein [Gammaproteobacteria bacterium]
MVDHSAFGAVADNYIFPGKSCRAALANCAQAAEDQPMATHGVSIDSQQQQLVITTTLAYLRQAGEILRCTIAPIAVRFDLKGQAAGMYGSKDGVRAIRYNPWLFAKFFDDNLHNTVPHEVAHYLCDVLYGRQRIRPHGQQWRALMLLLGASPHTKHRYDLQGIPQRRQRRYPYRCACRTHALSVQRHRRIQHGQGVYWCRHCQTPLQDCGTATADVSLSPGN